MSIRFAKQLIYGTLYAVIWVLIFWFGYRLTVHPAAPAAAAPVTQPIAVLSVSAFASGAGHNTFLAKIANPNSDFAAESFDYAFNLYDASGTLLQSFPARSFLYSSEVKYLLAVNEPVPAGVARADLTITTADWVTAAAQGLIPQLAARNVSTQVGSSTVVAAGQLTDNDTAAFRDILIIGIFKDASGNPIGASQTGLDGIVPDQSENFSVAYPAIDGINPAATEIEAYAER